MEIVSDVLAISLLQNIYKNELILLNMSLCKQKCFRNNKKRPDYQKLFSTTTLTNRSVTPALHYLNALNAYYI